MSIENRQSLNSVVVTLDGEAKCGKTALANRIFTETTGLDSADQTVIPEFNAADTASDHQTEPQPFNSTSIISAGSMFRAATLYKALLGVGGIEKTEFSEDDTEPLRGLLTLPGIRDVLETDPNIKGQVHHVSKLKGAQSLAQAIFADEVRNSYFYGGGGNLVIIDARDPVGTLFTQQAIGSEADQIDPASIIPIYIDTPTEVAAARLSGDFDDNLAEISSRRYVDATRPELPVTKPSVLEESFPIWLQRVLDLSGSEAPVPALLFDNGELVDMKSVYHFCGQIAAVSQLLGRALQRREDHSKLIAQHEQLKVVSK